MSDQLPTHTEDSEDRREPNQRKPLDLNPYQAAVADGLKASRRGSPPVWRRQDDDR